MASWSEDCNKYIVEHSTLSPAIADAPPVKRICRASGVRSQNIHDYNIITAKAPNSKAEESHVVQKIEEGIKSHNKAVDKYFRITPHGYDIITMEGKYGANKEEVDKRKGNREPRGVCVNYYPSTAQYAIYPECYIDNPPTPKTKRKQEAQKEKWKAERRNYNLINHQYDENHEEKIQKNEDMRYRTCNAAFSSNIPVYNPLTTMHSYQEMEETAQKEKELKEEKIRDDFKNHTYKVSNIVGQSDGHAYDIINARVYNPSCLLAAERRHMKGLPQRAALRRTWEQQRDVDEAIHDVIQQRSSNRINQIRRLHETIDRGYQIITNIPYESETYKDNGAVPIPPIPTSLAALRQNPLKPLTVAEKLLSQNPKPVVTTTLARTDGPRTTHERVFLVPSSEISLDCSTNEARRKLLQPVLQNNNADIKLDTDTSSSVVGSNVTKPAKNNVYVAPLHSCVQTSNTGGIKAFY